MMKGGQPARGQELVPQEVDEREVAKPRTAHQLYMHDHLHRMHNEIESTTRKLELEKRRLNKLDDDVVRTRSELEEKLGKDRHQAKEREEASRKVTKDRRKLEPWDIDSNMGVLHEEVQTLTMRKLEHRLSKALGELNKYNHENKEARNKIDQIRRERLQMNQVFKKLTGDIKENIGSVTSLQKDTDGARREHEERLHRMRALQKQVDLERKNFKETVQKLQKDMKDREREELIERVARVKESLEHGEDDRKSKTRGLKADEEENFNSTAVMRRILKLAFLNAIQRRHIRQHQKNIEVFEQAFATIKSTTGISDIEEIVKIFVSLEQRNFSLLTYVNNLNREIESLEKRNRQLDDQLKFQRRLEDEGETRRTATLAELKQQIASTSASTEENVQQATEQAGVLERCRDPVEKIMKTVEKENRGFGGQPAPESSDSVLGWLTYIEKTLTQWKDFLPETKDTRNYKSPNKNYKYTVGNQVLGLPIKKQHQAVQSLVKQNELPSAASVFQDQNAQAGARAGATAGREEDSDTDEEDMQNHPWTRQELRDKAQQSVAKRKKHRKTESQQPAVSNMDQQRAGDLGGEATAGAGAAPAASGAGAEEQALGYEEMVEKKDADEDSRASDDSDLEDEAGPSDEEINEIFLKRYKMSREELQGMADKMGIQLNNLCYLKQEFDAYDEDRSGYIDVKELKELLEKLGEELSEGELDQAFRELDSDGSGEIEFFEFVEWFTSED